MLKLSLCTAGPPSLSHPPIILPGKHNQHFPLWGLHVSVTQAEWGGSFLPWQPFSQNRCRSKFNVAWTNQQKKIVNITYNNPGYILRRKPHFHGIIVRTFPHRLLQLWPKYGINSSVLDYRNENFLVPTKLLNFNNIARILNTIHFNQQCLLSYAWCLSHEIDVCWKLWDSFQGMQCIPMTFTDAAVFMVV